MQPTVYLMVGHDDDWSALAFDDRGEILETVDFYTSGKPDWTTAGVCDHRGAGGGTGFRHLANALFFAEKNAQIVGHDIVHVTTPS